MVGKQQNIFGQTTFPGHEHVTLSLLDLAQDPGEWIDIYECSLI